MILVEHLVRRGKLFETQPRYDENQLRTFPLIPRQGLISNARSRSCGQRCQTLRSNRETPTELFVSCPCSEECHSAAWVGLFPYYVPGGMLTAALDRGQNVWLCVWSKTARSVNFDMNCRLLTGRRLQNTEFKQIFFRRGLTRASFHSPQNWPDERERLIMRVIEDKRTSRHLTTNGVGIGSNA